MIKKSFFFGLALLVVGQLLVAQSFQIITLSADGEETSYVVSSVQKVVFENNTMTVNMKEGNDVTNIMSIGFSQELSGVDYSKLKLNEISGVGGDSEKFYELINIGDEDIELEGCKIYYNNDPFNAGYTAPLTWTGCAGQKIKAGELLSLIGRGNPCSFTTGLTAQRIIKVTFFDPDGNLIDEFTRAQDTGIYAIADKSFSRIPDGTGPFYFTTPTPDAFNGSDATGLLLVPQTDDTGIESLKVESSIFIFPNPVKEYITVSGVKKDAIINLYDLNGRLLQTISAQENSTNINVLSLQQGTYLLRAGEHTIKFVKQ